MATVGKIHAVFANMDTAKKMLFATTAWILTTVAMVATSV